MHSTGILPAQSFVECFAGMYACQKQILESDVGGKQTRPPAQRQQQQQQALTSDLAAHVNVEVPGIGPLTIQRSIYEVGATFMFHASELICSHTQENPLNVELITG
eukprot:scaffold584571_cov20-Prasinocladus_malaysianus.AAC.1